MRLLSVIHGPVFGGAHNQLLRLSGPLAERGFETTAVLPDEAGAAAERFRGAGIETVTLPLHRLRATASPVAQARFLATLRREVRALERIAAERGTDVVQAHGPTNPHAALAARRARAGLVWQILDTRAPMALRRATMPLVTRLADAVTVWGEELARVHPGATRLGERLVVVYPPVDSDELRPDPERRAAARDRLGVVEGTPLIGSLGVLNPQKGHEHLVRAAAIVRRSLPGAAVRVLGSPSPAHAGYGRGLRGEAAALGLGASLDFLDPGPDALGLLQGLDVFALTSVPRSEGMPTAILEAMALAKPVVATDVGAVRELVEDGVSGLVVAPERPEAIAAALQRLLADAGLRARMGEAGRRRAVERFGLDGLADLHARAYELAAARAHPRHSR